jgi:hypothetical protein
MPIVIGFVTRVTPVTPVTGGFGEALACFNGEALFGYAQRVTTGDVPGFATKSK